MAQNITLLGASYSDVPAVQLPKTGGGTARFDDCTVVTAAAGDVASGKVFVASDGTVTTGTASGGSGGNPIRAFAWGRGTSTSYLIRDETYYYDEDYFSYDYGQFECKKAGTYDITVFGRGGYNNGGSNIRMYVQIYKNSHASTTTEYSNRSIANGGVLDTFSLSLDVGDKVYGMSRNSSGTNTHDYGYIITTPTT